MASSHPPMNGAVSLCLAIATLLKMKEIPFHLGLIYSVVFLIFHVFSGTLKNYSQVNLVSYLLILRW